MGFAVLAFVVVDRSGGLQRSAAEPLDALVAPWTHALAHADALHWPRARLAAASSAFHAQPGLAAYALPALLRDASDAILTINEPLPDAAAPFAYTYEDRREPLAKYHASGTRASRSTLADAMARAKTAHGFVYVSHKLSNASTDVTLAGRLGRRAERDWPVLRAAARAVCARESVSQLVWMGNTGASAGWHYDNTHNMFLQISGSKRWQIALPNASLDVFPDLHPHARQLIDGASLSVVADVVLQPGDLILVPAFFLHRVTTVSGEPLSVAVNTWCESSAEEDLYRSARSVLPPIDPKWPRPQLVLALKLFVGDLVAAVGLEETFVRDAVLERQYGAWLRSASDETRDAVLDAVAAFGGCQFSERTVDAMRANVMPHFRAALAHQSSAFLRISNGDVRRLLLARFVSKLALSAFAESVDDVLPFLAACFGDGVASLQFAE